jgi:hypothetical protein
MFKVQLLRKFVFHNLKLLSVDMKMPVVLKR